MEGSPFSTCTQILSQAKQTRMVDGVAFTLQPTTVFLTDIWQKKCRENIKRSADYFWNKRFKSLQSSQWKACRLCPVLYRLSVIHFDFFVLCNAFNQTGNGT